jgi:gas vesicle structural protein
MSEFRADLARDLTLVEVLDRVVERGVVLSGDITISVADVDLIYLGLRVLIRTPIQNGAGRSTKPATEEREDSDDLILRLRDRSERD